MVPPSGRSKPASRRSSVVLPLPDAPSTAVSAPGATRRLTASSTGRAPKALPRPLIRSSAKGQPGSAARPNRRASSQAESSESSVIAAA